MQFTVIISRHTLMGEDDLAWLSEVAADHELSSEQRAVLVSMRHGEVWTNGRVRQEFVPMDSVAARRLLQQLVDTGVAQMHGERGGATYTIAATHRLPEVGSVVVEELPPTQPTLPGDSLDASDVSSEPQPTGAAQPLTRNGGAVLRALAHPLPLSEVIAATGLTEGQVRYALTQLIASGRVVMLGSQGVRGTTYVRRGHQQATRFDSA